MSVLQTIAHHSVGKLVKVLHSYIFEQIYIRNDIEWLLPKEYADKMGDRGE